MKTHLVLNRLVLLCAVLIAAFARAADEPGVGLESLKNYVASLEGERREAGEFLLEHLPEADQKSLSTELFRENLEQAYLARETYPWTKALPKELFFNDVLPHAVVNETRDPWRKRLRELFHPHLGDSQDVRAAAAVVGAKIAELTGVKYDTNREKACQSPAESMRQGMASCTGLSILQVDALRAVGVPVRLAGIPMWGTMEGNHTWVEIHDGKGWQMSGYGGSPEGWNKGWEIARCAYCDPLNPVHGVFVSSYRPTGIEFPMIWDWNKPQAPGSPSGLNDVAEQERDAEGKLVKLDWRLQSTHVPGIDRTAHYIELAGGRKIPIPKGSACVAIRAFITGSESRIDVPIRVFRGDDLIMEGRTASAAQDLNDYVRILCPPGALKVEYKMAGDEWKSIDVDAAADKETPVRIDVTEDQATGFFKTEQRRKLADWFRNSDQAWPGDASWPELADEAAVGKARDELWSIFRESQRSGKAAKELGPLPATLAELMARAKEGKPGLAPGSLTLGEHQMPFVLIRKESKAPPASGRALYICMHGGGRNPDVAGPHAWDVNSREWQSQASLAAGLYAGEGIFFVPRMADDRLGRWWMALNQDAFDAVIRHALLEWDVDPDRVYIMGISEGAYGTQILGPFMADRFGGANAMAGGVGDDVPAENLRNLAFRTDVGENDTMFDRVGLARKFHARMDAGKEKHGGYPNHLEVQAGKGHGVDYKPGGEWMIQHHREARPDTIVWTAKPLDHRRRPAFYWLGLRGEKLDGPIQLAATSRDNAIEITALTGDDDAPLTEAKIEVMLDAALVDMSREVTVTCNGKQVFSGLPERRLETLARTLIQRGDPGMSFPSLIRIDL